jgi:cell division protein FtsB
MHLSQKTLSWILIGVLLLLQIPVWFTKGGWLSVWRQQTELKNVLQANQAQSERNVQLRADVDDLADQGRGQAAVDERARYKLGMIRADEVFIQFVDKKQ